MPEMSNNPNNKASDPVVTGAVKIPPPVAGAASAVATGLAAAAGVTGHSAVKLPPRP